jgi:hypothetical protein
MIWAKRFESFMITITVNFLKVRINNFQVCQVPCFILVLRVYVVKFPYKPERITSLWAFITRRHQYFFISCFILCNFLAIFAVIFKMVSFVSTNGIVCGICWRFRGTYRFYMQNWIDRRTQYVPTAGWQQPESSYVVAAQKITVENFTAVRT